MAENAVKTIGFPGNTEKAKKINNIINGIKKCYLPFENQVIIIKTNSSFFFDALPIHLILKTIHLFSRYQKLYHSKNCLLIFIQKFLSFFFFWNSFPAFFHKIILMFSPFIL